MAHDAASVRPRTGRPPGAQGSKPPPRRDGERRTYAALDLGTNNCRLLIARPQDDGFVIIDAFSRIVRLGEGLAASNRLSDAAIERAIAALTICADKLRRRHVTLVRSVATEACRRAENGADFVRRVHAETGIRLDVIGAGEEARLAVLGCQALLPQGEGPGLIFDIGGGSTELVLVETLQGPGADGSVRILDWFSAPWGVVSLTEAEGAGLGSNDRDAAAAGYARMKARAASAFADFATTLPRPTSPPRLLGTSGTVTTLASLHLGLASYDRRAVDGLVVPAHDMRAISARLAGMTISERAQVPCIGQERADLVVAGCAILEAIMDIWPADRLGVADRGIREGILRSLIARDGAGS